MERYKKESPITEEAKARKQDRPDGPIHLNADGKGTPLAEEFPSKEEKNTKSSQPLSKDNPAVRGI